jgi:hypothetical protein
MIDQAGSDDLETPVGSLFARLIDEGKAYAKAELGVVKAQASDRAERAKLPALLFAGALLLVIAAVVVLVMTIADALATLIGPLAGGLVAVLIALGLAGGLAVLGKNRIAA